MWLLQHGETSQQCLGCHEESSPGMDLEIVKAAKTLGLDHPWTPLSW